MGAASSLLAKDPVLKEIVERLSREFSPEEIILFGSRARGQETSDSDYDLLLIVSSDTEPRYRRMQRAQRALWGVWTAVDVLVLTREEFDREKTVVSSLPATILREGRKLYAA